MALTFFQKVQVMFRGWARRREEDAKRRDEEFLKRNAAWGTASGGQAPSPVAPPTAQARAPVLHLQIDREGLQVAYLDDSGVIAYFLDVQTGDVVEIRGETLPDISTNPARYKRVPQRGADADDRKAFVETLEPSPVREFLRSNINTNDFRKILAGDRSVERGWYNFRNQRATSAIESWIRSLGLH
jgi:hypothetical protein